MQLLRAFAWRHVATFKSRLRSSHQLDYWRECVDEHVRTERRQQVAMPGSDTYPTCILTFVFV
jgi:hypothetical protein